MHRIPNLRTSLILTISLSVAFAACGSDDTTTEQSADGVTESTAAVTEPPDATPSDARAPDTAPTDATIADTEPPPPSPETTIDESWREEAVAWCDQATEGLAAIAPPTSDEDVARFVQEHIALRDTAQSDIPEWPAELSEPPTDLDQVRATQDEWINLAAEQLAAGNVGAIGDPTFADTAWGSVQHSLARAARRLRRCLRSPASAAVPPTQRSSRRPT